ncbi:MAG: glycine--tRNA ligase [Sulfolobales archaeon]|nr:glycine--tRNA ligase [Sulfolobales archaeon]
MSNVHEKVVELAKRRGIFWPSYEIYGGVAGLYDLGPIGLRIKDKIVRLWRKFFVEDNDDMVVEIETPLVTPSRVLEASGHVENFTDPIVECKKCGRVFRADHLVEEALKINAEGLKPEDLTRLIREHDLKCPVDGGELGEVRLFNLLFRTQIGPYSSSVGYLRPETAQGMFTSFKRVYETFRQRLPLGIAQVGRVARNEISPRQGLIRMREFSIMEVEFFIDPESRESPPFERVKGERLKVLTAGEKEKGGNPSEFDVEELVTERIVVNPWMAYWMAVASRFVKALGIKDFYFEEKLPHERAHYSRQTFDQIALVKGEKVEISGHAYRGDYDLNRHSSFSGEDLSVFRKYEQPKVVKRKSVVVNKEALNKEGKDFVKEFMSRLAKMTPEEVEEALRRGETINGRPIANYVTIAEREEKVHGEKFIPHVVEPSFGVERSLYLAILNAYTERKDRTLLLLPKEIAPYQVAVFPLLEREPLISKAKAIYERLRTEFETIYDDSGSIGRRYARVDEIGVPYSVTVDPQSLEDNTVTIRDRDTWNQVRVKEEDLITALRKLLYENAGLESVGIPVSGTHE